MTRLKTLPSRVRKLGNRLPTSEAGSWRGGKRTAAQRGYGYRWQQFRLRYLAEHPLCVMCEEQGRVTEATVVDHVTPHRGDMDAFWAGPFQSLCTHHHSSEKQRHEAAGDA